LIGTTPKVIKNDAVAMAKKLDKHVFEPEALELFNPWLPSVKDTLVFYLTMDLKKEIVVIVMGIVITTFIVFIM